MKRWQRMLCLNLILVILLTMIPIPVFAEGDTEETVTVKFYLNDGETTEPWETFELAVGEYMELPAVNPVRNGYRFQYWYYLDENGIEQTIDRWDYADPSVTDIYAKWSPLTSGRTLAVYEPDGTLVHSQSLHSVYVNFDYLLLQQLPEDLVREFALITGLKRKSDGKDLGLSATCKELAEGTAEGDVIGVQLVCEDLPEGRHVVYYGVSDDGFGLHSGTDAYNNQMVYVQTVAEDAEEVTLADTTTFFRLGKGRSICRRSDPGRYYDLYPGGKTGCFLDL